MKESRVPARRGRGGPPPAEAGANLLVHDLKNLACRLAALCQNLHDHYEDPLFKNSALDVLDHTVGHLQRLAGEIRDHDGRILVKLRVDLNAILREAIEDSAPAAPSRIRVCLDAADLPAMWGDAFLLRRAFSCAIENAIEAMEATNRRGVIGISTALRRRRGRSSVLVEITDDGPGMSASFIREKMFRPFSSTKESGLGLGVYTMGQVAAMHAGTVRITSGEGAGTTVRFRFAGDPD